MRINLIAARASNGVIGRDGDLPWHLPDDLRRFKRLTLGHPILMGRKTWESIGRPLPGRRSIVVSRQEGYEAPGATVARDLDGALAAAAEGGAQEVFVIGGAELYREALPRAQRLYLTEVHEEVAGDVVFPPWTVDDWRLVEEEPHPADERHRFDFSFRTYDRRLAASGAAAP